MNLRSIFLYNIIPKKRMFIAFIGFLISSTIITGGGILLVSIVESTTSYLGESDDILVISNPAASTPYTSILPLELADTIKSIYGVIDVSPEVMTAAVHKNKAVYFRGVDITKFWQFTEVAYVEGLPLSENDTYDVSVGINYAERNNLEIGDLMTIFSTRSNAAIELRVKSIFVTSTLLDDEIIAPLWIGQFFSFETFNYITHIRVKIDLDLIPSKEIIEELVNSKYGLTTIINTPGGSTELNATVYVRTGKGTSVKDEVIINDYLATFNLPFGEYEVQAEIDGIFSEPVKFILDENTTKSIYVNYIEREIQFHVVTDDAEPIEDVRVTVYNSEEGVRLLGRNTRQRYTDQDGYASLIVGNGSYIAEFSYGEYWKSFNFVTQETNEYEITLISRHPQIIVKSPLNFSKIIGDKLNISIRATTGYSIFFYPDGDLGELQEYHYSAEGMVPPQSMLVPFEEGFHSVTILTYNNDYLLDYDKSKNYAETTVFFTISSDFPADIDFLNVMNGSQIYPLTILELNETLTFNQGLLYKWDNNSWAKADEGFIVSPSEIGIQKLQMKAETTGESRISTYYFITKYTPDKIGIIGPSEGLIFKENDTLQTWFNPTFPTIQYHWDSNPNVPIAKNGEIIVQGLSEGNHTLYLEIDTGTLWDYREYEIMFDNTPPNITISATNGSSVETGSSLSYTINEPFSYVMFGWDDQDYSRSYEKSIPVPVENGFHNLRILTCDLAGNVRIANYTYNVINFAGSTAIDFYLQDEYSGLLNQSYIDLQINTEQSLFKIDYEIVGPSIVSFSRTNLEKERVYLHPGLYSLSVTYYTSLFESRKRTFEFHICDGQKASELYGTALNKTYSGSILVTFPYFDVSFTINDLSSIFVIDGTHDIYYMLTTYPGVQYNVKFIIDTELPEITIVSPNMGEEETDVFLEIDSNAVEVYFKLEHDSSLFLYNKTQVFLDYNQEGRQLITFFLIDSFYNTKTVIYEFYNGLSYVSVTLEFQVFLFGNDFNISFLDVSISSEYNYTSWTANTDINGKLSMNIFPGKFDVNFLYSNITYSFLLDTDDGLYQTIYLGNSLVTLTILDNYVGVPITNQYCIIRDLDGNRIAFLQTNSLGEFNAQIPAGDYIIHFKRPYELLSAPFQVYSQGQQIVFEIPSPRKLVQFNFVYDNGSKVYNLPVTFQTIIDGNFTTNTKLYSSITLWLPYSIVNISYFQLDGKFVTLTRSFEPGREVIKITIKSETDSQYGLIPFKPISGFTFIVSVALEYMDYYLKGSLLFTYTLAYTEIILILLIVIVNMYSILQNVYKENKRETRILRMIGGTTTNVLTTVFSRLGLVAVVTSFIGYGLGLAIIKVLASANQTVFFGHTFSPSGGWPMFLINGVLIIFIALITSLIITRNARKERRIVYSKR